MTLAKYLVVLAAALALTACTMANHPSVPADSRDPALAKLFEDYIEAWLPLNPLAATRLSLQQELDLPRFRQYTFCSAFGEGWAVYARTLGPQLGVLNDPYQKYGRLIGELRGATSLVVDTGLHGKGWSRDEALVFFRANAVGSEDLAENRIDRYMAWPGQTLSYLIGETKILELRARAQEALGEKFSLRDFHDEVLRDGNMPLAVLQDKIERWIAVRKRG